ncbi:MAG: hypothetical protein PVF56_01050 [Desulfobacterales bacterium]|jgi:hypothetical protein
MPPKKNSDMGPDQTEGLPATDREVVGRQHSGRMIIKDAAQYVKKHISKQPPVQRFFSFMPTLLTQVSPFHFKGRSKFDQWPLVRLDSGDQNSWGRMRVVGELLIIFDETILFCLLALMTKFENDAFETSQSELSQLADINASPNTFGSIWKSIQRLAGTRIDLELLAGRGKKRRALREMTGSILSFADMDRQTGNIRVVVNPYFLEMYAESFVTNIDLKFRTSLKSDVSKAFYRFYQGQYGVSSEIDMFNLASAVNLDIGQQRQRLRLKIRQGLSELQERGYLETFELTRDDRVIVSKSSDTAVKFDSQILDPKKIPYINDIGE